MDLLLREGSDKKNKLITVYLTLILLIAITFPSNLLVLVSGEEKGNIEFQFLVGNKDRIIQDLEQAGYIAEENQGVIFPAKTESDVVNLNVDNKTISFFTSEKTVSEVVNSRNIPIRPKDRIFPPPETKISAYNNISIVRVEEKVVVTTVKIPPPRQLVNSSEVALGKTVVLDLGRPGLKEITTKKVYIEGKLVEAHKISERVISFPKPLIYAVGGAVFRGDFIKKFTLLATAYGPPTVDRHVPSWITASGRRVRYGLVAVDPKVIPLGSKLWVENYGFAIAADTGRLIKGHRIDLFFFKSLRELNIFGRRYVTVYLLELPPPRKNPTSKTS
ncbi:MAG: Cell wall-binding protein YocH [candidate division WS2 bacterium]|nr:Cell wall-binding protein YocH [Candidatus Psychracetigena formicireducens]MBT9150011.1 Cell wall-binding protein YocH [Candidatus Psychracetigena formicireducens]